MHNMKVYITSGNLGDVDDPYGSPSSSQNGMRTMQMMLITIEASGTFAEYIAVPALTSLLRLNIFFEAGAGLSFLFFTAALAMHQYLQVLSPTTTGHKHVPNLIYGSASAVDAYALQLTKSSKVGFIITIAGSGIEFVTSLHAADHIKGHRESNVLKQILSVLGGRKLTLAFDAISHHGSYEQQAEGGGHINTVDPPADESCSFPSTVNLRRPFVSPAYGVKHLFVDDGQAQANAKFPYFFYR
ncbi:alcohol dehydrogenase [Paramyrothecium foliicola]|nr:alcohol dehydrogenase [Paramyrothecium foliicola]